MNAPEQKNETHIGQALIQTYWQKQLDTREQNRQKRRLRTPLAIDFCSNDYLGMARDGCTSLSTHHESNPRNPFAQLAAQFGTAHGSTGSRLLSGQAQIISELERAIAQFHQTEAALLFNSGFDANLGTLAAIGNRHTVFLYDDLCHASLIDGMRLSLSPSVYKFRHNDLNYLRQLLEQHAGKTLVIVVESLYSMDGDMAPLRELAELARQYRAALVVDEAHSTGVFGELGQGLSQQLGVHNDVTIRIHTYGKGMGCHGAAVVGSQTLIDYLINYARPFIYTTALPPASYAAIAQAYAQLHHNQHRRTALQDVIVQFQQLRANYDWQSLGVTWLASDSAIQGLIIGDVARTHAVAHALHAQNLDVRPILSPTVPAGSERLRICLHAFNTDNEIRLLCDILWRALSSEAQP